MGKSGRKNKVKRKDFQKVKLKVGKSKPAADNVTKATFKTGAVLVREQLKVDDSQPTTQRKQNINDLLCQLNHYNSKVRQESIWGMKELLSNHPELISEHLALLIDNLSMLFMDKDAAVRKATVSLLTLLFVNTSENNISPFMSVLMVYLCSAMTHIDEEIQLDSLIVVDLCLDTYPKLIVPHSKELLMNFVSQITRQRSLKPDFENVDLEILVNPDSKMTSQRWRLKVLDRLFKFLQALLSARKTEPSAVDKCAVPTVQWNKFKSFKQLYTVPYLMEGFTLRSFSKDTKSTGGFLTSESDLVPFVNTIIPLLMQCWMEVSPCLLNTGLPGNTLPAIAVETLQSVLGVLRLLLQWLEMICTENNDNESLNSVLIQHKKEFSQRLFSAFPYVEHTYSSTDQCRKASRAGANIPMLNLALAEVMSYFVVDKPLKGWTQRLLDHLVDELGRRHSLSVDYVKILLNILRRVICVFNKVDASVLLKGACDLHKRCHQKSQVHVLLLQYLADLAMQNHNFVSLDDWVSSLPNQLLELRSTTSPVNNAILQVISRAASRGHQTVLKALQENMSVLMDHEDGLILHVTATEQRNLLELLYWVPHIGENLLEEIALDSMDGRLACESISFAFQLLTSRCLASRQPDIRELLQCLLTSSLGVTSEILNKLQEKAAPTLAAYYIAPPKFCNVTLTECPSECYHRQTRICKIVCDCLKQLEQGEQVWTSCQATLDSLLAAYKTLPITSIQAILRTVCYLHTDHSYWPEKFLLSLSHCCLATLLATVSHYGVVYEENDWRNDMWAVSVNTFLKVPSLLETCLEVIDCEVQDVLCVDDISKTALVLIRLMQTERLSSLLVPSSLILQRVVLNIQNHPASQSESQWKVELDYEISLLVSRRHAP